MKLEFQIFSFDSFAAKMRELKEKKHFDYLVTIVGEDFGEEGLGCVYILENTETNERTSVKTIAKQVGDRYGVDNKKAASILDTFSCFVQGLIPYGAQMLMAAGLAALNPVSIIPHLYYPFAIGIAAILSILFRYPRRYS